MSKRKNTCENTSTKDENASVDMAAAVITTTEKATVQRGDIAPERCAEVFKGEYKAICPVNLRAQPDGLPILTELPKGCRVSCDGSYTMGRGARWLFVEAEIDGSVYAGFCSIDYLARL